MVDPLHARFPSVVGNRHLSFDSRTHRKSILDQTRLFLVLVVEVAAQVGLQYVLEEPQTGHQRGQIQLMINVFLII